MPEITTITNNLGRAMPLALLLLCLSSAWLLFSAPRRNTARNILASFLLLLGLSYVPGTLAFASGQILLHESLELNPFVLGATNIFIALLCLYPVEVIRPGWLNSSRTFRFMMPALAVDALYFLTVLGLRHGFTTLDSFSDFLTHAGQFDVWGRLGLILSALSYLAASVIFYARYSKPYMEWCEDNFSSFEGLSISWMTHYIIVLCILSVLFLITIFTASRIWLLVFDISLMLGISLLTFRGLFQTEAYPEDFFREGLDENRARHESARQEQELMGLPTDDTLREPGFDDNIEVFAKEIIEWFDSEKPYLDSGFQLSDVGEKIPVCRTYLSRIFNEGLGDSFSHIVRSHRLDHAAGLLVSRPEMPIAAVAMASGFSTPAAFNRAFSSAFGGLTPGKYRKERIGEK